MDNSIQYIWQDKDWPNFSYDENANKDSLYQYAMEAGRIAGGVGQLQESLQYEAYVDHMVREAIKTSEIEGEHLDREDVRSSIKNFLGISKPAVRVHDARAEGISALMVDLRESFREPLTTEKLCQWQSMAVANNNESYLYSKPVVSGKFRHSPEPMQIVSGPIGYEKVHYEAPPANRLNEEMSRFVQWFNNSSPINPENKEKMAGPVRAAIAHLWFECIHPFDDGNGRVGRAIAEKALAQDLGQSPLISLSTVIEKDRKGYYQELHDASRSGMDVSRWVNWFCQTTLNAQQEAFKNVDFVLKKANFWRKHGDDDLKERQIKAINKLFMAGPNGFEHGINAKKYIALSGCSKATATRDLSELVEKRCLSPLPGGGRNTRYALNLDGHDYSTQKVIVEDKAKEHAFTDTALKNKLMEKMAEKRQRNALEKGQGRSR